MFRGVDDFAFQKVLRTAHEDLIRFRIDRLFKIYAYGYGWLFWIIHVIITFPFYLISLLGSDFLLISTARNISLIFMIGACFFIFKSIKIYTKDKYIPYIAILLFVSYPYFAYSALSFRTIAQTSFFCTLTFYLLIRNKILSRKDLKYIAISFAACIGTKLNTMIFALLIGAFLADRFKFKLNKENLSNALYFFKYFIPFSIIFINPSLLLSPFKTKLLEDYLDSIKYHFKHIQTNYGSGHNFLDNFYSAFESSFLYKYVLIFFMLMFCIKIIIDIKSNKQNRFDYLYMFIFLIASSIYFSFFIRIGSSYITNYFFSFSFLLLFSITTLNKTRNSIKYTILVSLVSINTLMAFDQIKDGYMEHYNKYQSEDMERVFNSQKELQKLVGSPDQTLTLLIDYRAPVIYSNFRKNINMISIFDNISVVETWTQDEFDYILLHKDSLMLIDEKDFQRISINADTSLKSTWNNSRKITQSLLKTGKFRNSQYSIIYNKNKLIFFKRDNSLSNLKGN